MAWLFERIIELAAWVAFILCLIFLAGAGYYLYLGAQLWWEGDGNAPDIIARACQSAFAFVASALMLGGLACIDRYVFDLPETPTKT